MAWRGTHVSDQENQSKRMKVTDRRMFTPEGELREEFRHLDGAAPSKPPPMADPPPAADPAASRPTVPQPAPAAEPTSGSIPPEAELPPGGPGFLDLVSMLAEPAAVYLQQAQAATRGTISGDNQTAQALEIAKVHIDLLTVVKAKTHGNLDAQERAILDDAIFQLQRAFAQTRAAVGAPA